MLHRVALALLLLAVAAARAAPAVAHRHVDFLLEEHLQWRLVPVFVQRYGVSNSRNSGITQSGFSPRATR